MTTLKPKRKPRSDKFPLTLHKTGQYCKKIRGKIHYFGNDRARALARYLEQATSLHTGEAVAPKPAAQDMPIKTLCNMYLDHQETRATAGEIRPQHLADQVNLLKGFVRFIGANRPVEEISTIDLQSYRTSLIKRKIAPNTINNRLAAVKAMYNWSLDTEVIDRSPRLNAIKKITPPKPEKPVFTTTQIRRLLHHATMNMEAMIWLGLNCGFGCTDCAELKWINLDLKNGRTKFPRGKTGIDRNLPLWPETVETLKKLPKRGELVFYTRKGNPWVTSRQHTRKDGADKYTKNNALSKEFSRLMKKAGLKLPKGVGFYTLRRTAATLAAQSGDPFAVQKLLGHADVKMASTYVQNVSEQTDRVVNNSRGLIIQNDP